MDCKATVQLGEFSRGGQTRGDNLALDHDMGCEEKYVPFGLLDEDTSQLRITFGASAKTSDFIVDCLYDWWNQLSEQECSQFSRIQFKVDNGPESNGTRTQFLKRMVAFADHTQKTLLLLYYPPYHSKYNRIERTWGVLEQHWNGALLVDVRTMLAWAKTMTWKGIHPIVNLSRKVYEKGVSHSKAAMKPVEARLQRHSLLPKWDILIQPGLP